MTLRTRVAAALAVLLVAGLGAAGYFVGESKAPTAGDAEDARDAAYADALESAHDEAAGASKRRGTNKGLDQGRQRGRHVGTAAGERRGTASATEQLAAIEAQQAADVAEAQPAPTGESADATGCPPDYEQGITGCIVTDPDHVFSEADAQQASEEYDARQELGIGGE